MIVFIQRLEKKNRPTLNRKENIQCVSALIISFCSCIRFASPTFNRFGYTFIMKATLISLLKMLLSFSTGRIPFRQFVINDVSCPYLPFQRENGIQSRLVMAIVLLSFRLTSPLCIHQRKTLMQRFQRSHSHWCLDQGRAYF